MVFKLQSGYDFVMHGRTCPKQYAPSTSSKLVAYNDCINNVKSVDIFLENTFTENIYKGLLRLLQTNSVFFHNIVCKTWVIILIRIHNLT